MKTAEFSTRVRLIRILRTVIERPYGNTKQQLAERYGVSRDTISGDFEALETAGFVLTNDKKHRYAFVQDKPLKQLQDLLHFSAEDQALLHQAIDSVPTTTERQQNLKAKLNALYDFRRLGHAYLRKPHLAKMDLLLQAQAEKKQVILEGYRSSNSNSISDRKVEPFHISPPDDTLQAYDADKKALRHFRISRITRVRPTDRPWQYEGHHNIVRTDPFRIVNNDQVLVQLRLGVAAYNELIERYPLTKSYIEETGNPEVFDFQCMVNQNFYGLSNFMLGFFHLGIEIIGPEILRSFLREEVGRMKF